MLLKPQPSTKTFAGNKSAIQVLLASLVILFLPLAFIVYRVMRYTNGVFMYPLDDTFIHMDIADHVMKGTWGINNGEFASASSSLLYTVILSLFRLFSKSLFVPLFINCIAGVLCVGAVQLWLKKQGVKAIGQFLVVTLSVFFAPLALMMISGMEHTLQCFLSFSFIFFFSSWLQSALTVKSKRLPVYILLLAVCTATIRYEGLFLIGVAVLLLFYYKQFVNAFLLGGIAMLPLVLFGLYSVSKGGFFLPNSVLIKSDSLNYGGAAGFVSNVLFEKLTFARNGLAALATQRWLIILPLLWLIFRKTLKPAESFIFIFLTAATIIQLSLAATGYLYRYEAYLFFNSIVFTAYLFYNYGRGVLTDINSVTLRIVSLILVFFLFFPIALRSVTALAKAHQACINIFDQQHQMATFSKQYYNNTPIAANDIGAVGYYTDAKIVDLWGLADNEVAKSKKAKYWTPVFLDSLTKANKAPIAMVYDVWFNDSLRNHWKKAATWQIQNNVICGDDVVSFYAIDSFHYNMLLNNLKKYQKQLPPSVNVLYY